MKVTSLNYLRETFLEIPVVRYPLRFVPGVKKYIVVKTYFCYSCRRGLRRRQAEPDDADTESAQENNKVSHSVLKRLSHEIFF
jgi:hypothetical protein